MDNLARGGDVTVRAERPEDHAAIDQIVEAAFGSSAEVRLVNEIRASEFAIRELPLVAERDGRVVGHVMISYAEVDDGQRRPRIAMLSPLAVTPNGAGTRHRLSPRAHRHGARRRTWRARRRRRGQSGVLRTPRVRTRRRPRPHVAAAVVGTSGSRASPQAQRRPHAARSRHLPVGVRHRLQSVIRSAERRDRTPPLGQPRPARNGIDVCVNGGSSPRGAESGKGCSSDRTPAASPSDRCGAPGEGRRWRLLWRALPADTSGRVGIDNRRVIGTL